MAKAQLTVSDDAVIATQRMQYRCGCGKLFEGSLPVMCPMEVSVAYMQALRCPACGGRKRVHMGQDRTLAEDLSFGWGSAFDERVEAWAASGEFGQSSRAIFRRMLGRPHGVEAPGPAYGGHRAAWQDMMSRAAGPSGAPTETPCDPSDVRRCVLLLCRVPEWEARMPEMADVSPGWALLAPRWAEVSSTFREEVGAGLERRPAPRTHDVLRSALAGAPA